MINTTAGNNRVIRIAKAASAVEREPLVNPFGFKGGSLSELWQTAVQLKSEAGNSSTGLGVQSVLWSDPGVFSAQGEEKGNKLMYRITRRALQLLEDLEFTNPVSLLEDIFEEMYRYGRKITGRPDLRKTFVLNALVPVDNAAWLLYARENGLCDFEKMLPSAYQSLFSAHHHQLAGIPVIGYGFPDQAIRELLDQGYFFLKIKMGHPGTQQEMLQKDKEWLTRIHCVAKDAGTVYTPDGKIRYYLDLNGRYEHKDRLAEFLDHARQIGAFDRIALIEEPFPDQYETPVADLGVRIAADESVHTDRDVLPRAQMGYSAIALKAVAKTLSMTVSIFVAAHQHNISCFCADLTANPVLVEWNKNVAARLPPFPELPFNLLESNGPQNYKNWETLCSYNPSGYASWARVHGSLFELDDEYYRESGGIFRQSAHYESLFNQ